VVYVGSMLDKQGDLSDLTTIPDFLSLQRFSSETFKSFDAYSTSKLAGTLLHLELANRLKADSASAGLAINAASPGMVNTELNRHLLPWPVRARCLSSVTQVREREYPAKLMRALQRRCRRPTS